MSAGGSKPAENVEFLAFLFQMSYNHKTFIDMNGGADGLIPADGKRLCDNPTSGAGNAPA